LCGAAALRRLTVCRETAVVTSQVAVLIYSAEEKKWQPSGPGNGVSKIYLYKNNDTGAFRIVGRNLSTREV
jgi:hypothetical protein